MLNLNFAPKMGHRTVEIRWLPSTESEWATYTAVRAEAASLWNRMVKIHARIRRSGKKWPLIKQWREWSKGKFKTLGAQSVSQIMQDFCDAISATTKARRAQKAAKKTGEELAKYPWRTKHKYRDVIYSNQGAILRNGLLRLSNSASAGPLFARMPIDRQLVGRIMEVTLVYGAVRIVCEVAGVETRNYGPLVGVDLGVNTLVAATDGKKAILVSGRGAKAIIQYRNKTDAELRSRIDRSKPGSKRRKRLAKARRASGDKSSRQIRDLLHKATRTVADAFPGSSVTVGKPFNNAARKLGRVQAQQVSEISARKIICQLSYKLVGACEKPEHYSSQTCPVCGRRQKCRRVYECSNCGLSLPRDVVGSVNIRSIGLYDEMRADQPVPADIKFVRVQKKYPSVCKALGSSGGIPARKAA